MATEVVFIYEPSGVLSLSRSSRIRAYLMARLCSFGTGAHNKNGSTRTAGMPKRRQLLKPREDEETVSATAATTNVPTL